jgi:predicted DNA-binding transcriptional regulator AlpA
MNAQVEIETQAEMRNRRIGAAAVKQMCGGVSDMAIWRWLKEGNFPQPQYIGNRRYWRAGDVMDWLDNRPTEATPRKPRKDGGPTKAQQSITPSWQK